VEVEVEVVVMALQVVAAAEVWYIILINMFRMELE
jgi:hypothetical protein